MRKLLIGAASVAALAVPANAVAQNPQPVVESDIGITPSNAGTKSKPTAAKFSFKVVNSRESKTTVSRIRLQLPAGVKLDGARLQTCEFADLVASGPSACSSGSRLGKGVAYAFIVQPTTPAPDCVGSNGKESGCLTFDASFYVGGRRLLSVWLQQREGTVQRALQGRISGNGRRLTIEIPKDLQSPAPNTFSALSQLSGSFKKSRRVGGKRYSFVSTTACPGTRRWAVRSTLYYAANIFPAPVPSRSAEDRVNCRR